MKATLVLTSFILVSIAALTKPAQGAIVEPWFGAHGFPDQHFAKGYGGIPYLGHPRDFTTDGRYIYYSGENSPMYYIWKIDPIELTVEPHVGPGNTVLWDARVPNAPSPAHAFIPYGAESSAFSRNGDGVIVTFISGVATVYVKIGNLVSVAYGLPAGLVVTAVLSSTCENDKAVCYTLFEFKVRDDVISVAIAKVHLSARTLVFVDIGPRIRNYFSLAAGTTLPLAGQKGVVVYDTSAKNLVVAVNIENPTDVIFLGRMTVSDNGFATLVRGYTTTTLTEQLYGMGIDQEQRLLYIWTFQGHYRLRSIGLNDYRGDLGARPTLIAEKSKNDVEGLAIIGNVIAYHRESDEGLSLLAFADLAKRRSYYESKLVFATVEVGNLARAPGGQILFTEGNGNFVGVQGSDKDPQVRLFGNYASTPMNEGTPIAEAEFYDPSYLATDVVGNVIVRDDERLWNISYDPVLGSVVSSVADILPDGVLTWVAHAYSRATGSWYFCGEAQDGDTTMVLFELSNGEFVEMTGFGRGLLRNSMAQFGAASASCMTLRFAVDGRSLYVLTDHGYVMRYDVVARGITVDIPWFSTGSPDATVAFTPDDDANVLPIVGFDVAPSGAILLVQYARRIVGADESDFLVIRRAANSSITTLVGEMFTDAELDYSTDAITGNEYMFDDTNVSFIKCHPTPGALYDVVASLDEESFYVTLFPDHPVTIRIDLAYVAADYSNSTAPPVPQPEFVPSSSPQSVAPQTVAPPPAPTTTAAVPVDATEAPDHLVSSGAEARGVITLVVALLIAYVVA